MTFKRALFILLMLALPWQTRWFSDAGLVAGYPWEQGRISVYASWLVLLAFVAVSLWQKRPVWRRPSVIEMALAAGLVVPAIFSSSLRASAGWLLSVVFAAMVFWVVRREGIAAKEIAFWFALSLVPHALLGMSQFAFQFGGANKWLGLSLLDPQAKGVAVILDHGTRYLRAYGGFPHPNIFAGYLALSLLFLMKVWAEYSERAKKIAFVLVPFLSMALAFTASRSAWLALLIGLIAFLFSSDKRRLWSIIIIPFVLVLAVFPLLVRPVSMPSVGAVEEKSVNERVIALQQAPAMFQRAPIFGTGPGALLPALVQHKLEPLIPHAVPVMVLLETGLWGFVLLLLALGYWVKGMRDKRLLLALTPLLLLDHYLWSYWSGLVLFAVLLAKIP